MKILQQADQLFWQGKFQEALEQLYQLETQEEIPRSDLLKRKLLKCRIYAQLDINKAQTVADQIIQASQNIDPPLIPVDTYLVMAEAWLAMGKLDTSIEVLNKGNTILETLKGINEIELIKRKATVLVLEGGFYAAKGDLEPAFKCIQQSLTLREQVGTPQEIAHSLFYLGRAHFLKGEYERALDHIQQSLTLREQLGIPQELAQSFLCLGQNFEALGKNKQALDCFQKSLTINEQLGTQQEIALSLYWIGVVYWQIGELNTSLEVLQQSLAIAKQLDIPDTYTKSLATQGIGAVYYQQGALEWALEYFLKALAMEEARGDKTEVGFCLYMISVAYRELNNFEKALEYAMKSLQVREDIGNASYSAQSLSFLVRIFIDQNQIRNANKYLKRLEEIRNKTTDKHTDQRYRYTRALILKTSSRPRDKIKAQELFQQIADDEIIFFWLTGLAILHLCDLLFIEFKFSGDPDILHEIKSIINRFLDLAQEQHAYPLIAEIYVLQAKLALIDIDLPRARRLFAQAQVIADDKGLQRLARSISHEHDELLAQLPQWEALTAQNTSLVEISELTGVEEHLTRLAQQRAAEPPELQPEAPVLLLILVEGGLTIFSHSFESGHQLDDQLIGNFLTALSAFGQDALTSSGTVDRIMYEDYTVAVKPHTTLLFCYIFQGQSYLALQKLNQFLKQVREAPELHQALTTVTSRDPTAKALVALDPTIETGLRQLITEIF